MGNLSEISHAEIKIASPESILKWSYGEVLKPETLHYRTLRPEPDGLFCEKIFGPVKDGRCGSNCNKYSKGDQYGVVCERCGVEVTSSRVRRERMAHVTLALPVVHFWYFKNNPFYIEKLLDIKKKDLELIIYCYNYIVTDPGDTPLEKYQLLTTKQYEKAYIQYMLDDEFEGRPFKAGIGGEVVREMLESLDLQSMAESMQEELLTANATARGKLESRLSIVKSFINSGNKPEHMVLTHLPIIPAELRPMVQLDGGKTVTSDLNDFYRRIMTRNDRLKRMIAMGMPKLIMHNEIRLLQEAIDNLFENDKSTKPFTGTGNKKLKSLSDAISKKHGRFRQNLLGKRVDYSGRSVIIVGSELHLHQCGLPRKMAIELFRPFVIGELVRQGIAHGVDNAKTLIELGDDSVWRVLEEVVKRHPVILNRQPTLHKLSLRSFEIVLIEGEAIRLHPLVCAGYNADFDGDQMAIHIPLSREAQAECHILLSARVNLLHPQSGKSAVTPSQDMILGCYYLSLEKDGAKGEGGYYSSIEDAQRAYELGHVALTAKIIVNVKNYGKIKNGEFIVTTPGKILFNEKLPKNILYINDGIIGGFTNGVYGSAEEAYKCLKTKTNSPFDKTFIGDLIDFTYDQIGNVATADMMDGIKDIGFKAATKGGLTFSYFDINHSDEKAILVSNAEKMERKVENMYQDGWINDEDRYEEIVRIWSRTNEWVGEKAKEKLSSQLDNPIFMMIGSRARGNWGQYGQVAGMRGLMAGPSGKTIERAIKSNFKEGLTNFEYFFSSHGARKGMADSSLKTADAGYLTRKLVYAAQNVVITEEDCGTSKNAEIREFEDIESLEERIEGRFLAETYGDFKAGTYVTNAIAKELSSKYDSIKIRSLLTCETKGGVCKKCYGMDLARRDLPHVGEPVGFIAAQSIGEPGTQLTMRTFHTGGVAGDDITTGLPRIKKIFEASPLNGPKDTKAVISHVSGRVTLETNGQFKTVIVSTENGEAEEYPIPSGMSVKVSDGQMISVGQQLSGGSVNPHELLELTDVPTVQNYLLKEVQAVYRIQGVNIDDKHIEVILRQMFSKSIVLDSGDSGIEKGELVETYEILDLNKTLEKEGKKIIEYKPQASSIINVALNSSSFLSAASYAKTSIVLTDASVKNRKDYLKGIKESIIVGKKIPAGTGLVE